jgi:hypothetical protein
MTKSFHFITKQKMATKLKLIISILRFLSLMTLFTKSIAQSPNYVGDDCKNSTQQSLTSTYKSNLNKVLSLLSSDAIVSKGYNHTSIGDNTIDGVYGLYDCRGDVVGSFCQFCVSTAASDILQHCPNRASATIWYNFCILRYMDLCMFLHYKFHNSIIYEDGSSLYKYENFSYLLFIFLS